MSSSKGKKKVYRSRYRNFLNPLFSRMLVSYLTVTLCLIVAVGVTVVAICKSSLDVRSEAELVRIMNSVSETVHSFSENGNDSLQDASLHSAFTDISRENGAMIQIVTAEGTQSFYTNALWLSVSGISVSPEETIQELGNDMRATAWSSAKAGILVRTGGIPVYSDGDLNGVLLVHMNDTELFANLQTLLLSVLLVSLIAVFIATLVVYYTTKRMVRPFMEINDTVQLYSKGNFNKRIPVSNITEASQLARSFNAMADQLNDLESTRRSFVSNVSHELRSPLTSMGGFLEAMHDGTIPPEEFDKYLEIVLSENKRMTLMVNDLLDLARIESGKTVMRPEVFDINELIRRVLLTFEARIYEQKLDVEVKFAQENLLVEADNAQISQVLRNLIDNAIKYSSPNGGKLRLSSYAMRSTVYVGVSDSGIGIPDEDIPFVFDRFYKVEKSHTPRKQSGTGLGLSIVKKILDQHGQTISVQSMQGKGTTFTFTLKRAHPPRKQPDLEEEGVKYGI